MKGLELPMNTMVILIIVVIVLVVVGAYFILQSSSGVSQVALSRAYEEGCITLRTAPANCDHTKVTQVTTSYSTTRIYSLGEVCALRNLRDSVSCAKSCGCAAEGTGIALNVPGSATGETRVSRLALIPESVTVDARGNVI